MSIYKSKFDYRLGNLEHSFGKGGLGYKPKPYIIGGMAKRDINEPGMITYEYDGNNKENLENLIASKPSNERLLGELGELVEIIHDANFEGDKELKKEARKEFNKIIDELNIRNLSDSEKEIIEQYKKENKNKGLNQYGNEFYSNVKDEANQIANNIYDEYMTTKKESKRDEIESKYIRSNEELSKEFDQLLTKEQKADMIKGITENYERGNISEDKLIENPELLTIIDNDHSPIINTKDERAYNPDFIHFLKDKLNATPSQIHELLEKMNIDGVKDNTIWELKSFGKSSYDKMYDKSDKLDYSKAKFYGSIKSFFTFGNNLYSVKYTIDKIDGKDLIGNITYFITRILDKDQEKDLKDAKKKNTPYVGSILKKNPKGYKYYILENNKDKIQYINPLKDKQWKRIETHFENISNKKINFSNLDFIKLPKQYESRYYKKTYKT